MADTDFNIINFNVIYEQETGWGGLRGSSVWLMVTVLHVFEKPGL